LVLVPATTVAVPVTLAMLTRTDSMAVVRVLI